ncbi:glycosyltransferase [Ectobacillus sp. sgz5001026]|uniref:glycosyltransferase n=1 Tax=Ectobacillus sp. sgz5001026 TaxID=3242473 RepID=UPI0036D26048
MSNLNEKLQTGWMYVKKVFAHMQAQGISTTFRKVQKRVKTQWNMMKGTHQSDQRVRAIYEEVLASYNSGAIKGVAIISSGMEFDELYNQRTINFAKYLAKRKYGVLYITWQYDEMEEQEKSFQHVYSNLYQIPLYPYVYSKKELSIFSPIKTKVFISTFPAKTFYSMLPLLKEQGFQIEYDIMDEWEEFFKTGEASWYQRSVEEAFITEADVVSAVSSPLRQKYSHIRGDILVVGNGYDENISKHPNISNKTKRADGLIHIGYFGHMTPSWFDWDLLFHLAKQSDIHIHLIGHGAPETILKKVERIPNITFYGKVHPGELHEYARMWHVGIIPFKKSKLSEAVDPIKIYEYLYFGLPTVSTGIPHIGTYPYVYHCETFEQAEQTIRSIYDEIGTMDHEALQSFLAETTWTKQFQKIENELNRRK